MKLFFNFFAWMLHIDLATLNESATRLCPPAHFCCAMFVWNGRLCIARHFWMLAAGIDKQKVRCLWFNLTLYLAVITLITVYFMTSIAARGLAVIFNTGKWRTGLNSLRPGKHDPLIGLRLSRPNDISGGWHYWPLYFKLNCCWRLCFPVCK